MKRQATHRLDCILETLEQAMLNPQLVNIVFENDMLLRSLIAKEIAELEASGTMTCEERLYALTMLYRAALLHQECDIAA